ncbi:serine/threonine-protein kinase [Bacillus carboniphilus]|uniref:Serine/threonine-protein kinase n=1 Tax=Bacillus carboniphilus TaxID=86663 RepID=A0ABY9JU30_9BACI|nr:serine/threonine-protein kinase [Bacillus carboniphilus]WLR41940.1 serine/threonine-protein kinase [Bacillus carboniphilus]
MMNRICKLPRGSTITGKWHKGSYIILKSLGHGANGTVYLCQSGSSKVALKISENNHTITSEVNVLRKLMKVQSASLGPYLVDVDDWIQPQTKKRYFFYAMEYIEGSQFITFLEANGLEWTDILVLQLLRSLGTLHSMGWVFGDLKPDNLIVSSRSYRIRCIDLGGTTLLGRSIKEFTEFFDRGYWDLGTRKAEPSYDLFSVSMIYVNVVYKQRFQKVEGNNFHRLKAMIEGHPFLQKRKTFLLRSLEGNYLSVEEMKHDILAFQSSQFTTNQNKKKTKPTTVHSRVKRRKKKKWGLIFESFLLAAIVGLLYVGYVFHQLL